MAQQFLEGLLPCASPGKKGCELGLWVPSICGSSTLSCPTTLFVLHSSFPCVKDNLKWDRERVWEQRWEKELPFGLSLSSFFLALQSYF